MPNQLLLLQDVEGLGRSGDVVSNVKPGYMRNYLIPKKLGVIADKNAIRMQARLQEERKAKAAADKKESEAIAKQLETLVLETTVKVDPEGHMYGSVSTLDICHLLEEQAKVKVEKRALLLKHPIRKIGVHHIPLKLKEEVETSVTLKVIAEGVVEEPKVEETVS